MKKFLCLFIAILITISLCGCSYLNYENQNFGQEVTIVKMPSPPKCKTTDDLSTINRIISILGEIEKTPIEDENINGGWYIMIKLNVDGKELIYTVGGVFTDSDGRQYDVSNYKEIEDKLTKIYNEINVPEVNYP